MKVESEEQKTMPDFSKIGGVEGKSVDLKKYKNQITTIEKVEVLTVPSRYTELIVGTDQHMPQWVLKVSSVILEEIGDEDNKIQFRASEIFNLIQDKNGLLTGFPTGEGSNLCKFIKDIGLDISKITNLQELMNSIKGKNVVIKAYEKNEKTYLTFKY